MKKLNVSTVNIKDIVGKLIAFIQLGVKPFLFLAPTGLGVVQ